MLPLLTTLIACALFEAPLPPRPSAFVPPRVDATGASPALQLWRMPATYTLPDTNRPPDYDPSARFTLQLADDAKRKVRPGLRAWKAKLPFDVGDEARRFAPKGMTVSVDGEELAYGQNAGRSGSWKIKGRQILVTLPDGQVPTNTIVAWKGLQELIARHELDASGLSEADFVQYAITLDQRTRQGLLLNAPGRAEWTLTLPDGGATFDSWVALEPAPVLTDVSDGAVAVLTVVEPSGTVREVGRRSMSGPSTEFVHWRVSLDRYAGQQITLRLESEPGAHNHFDYIFYGSPTIWGPPSGEPRRIIVIGLDTTRPDKFGFYGNERGLTESFDAVAAQSVVFDSAWTSAPRTRPSFRSATTGRNPLDAVGATNIAEVFSERGFATAGYVANVHLQPRFGFDTGFDDWWFDGQSKADDQIDRALTFLDRYQERDVYMFMHIMDPHIFYRAPGSYHSMWVTDSDPDLPSTFNRWEVYGWQAQGGVSDTRKSHIEALYDGELTWTSDQLARFFDRLDRMGGRTLVIVHNDHGEEFWEHDGFEHNHTLYNEVTKAVWMLRTDIGYDAEPIRLDAPVTLQDIAPTLYDYAGVPPVEWPAVDGRSVRPLIEGSLDAWGHERPIGVAHLRYGHDRWGVVVDHHKYVLHTRDGEQELYDLRTDPPELENLAEALREEDLVPFWKALGEAHGGEEAGVYVGRGWRIRGAVYKDTTPLVLTLPRPARRAGVIDPELTIDNPKNQAWGEPPRRTVAEIGEVTLSDDGLTMTWEPGTNPRDVTLYVLFPEGDDLSVSGTTATRGEDAIAFLKDPLGNWSWRQGVNNLRIEPGTILAPPPGEAARMRALASDDAEEMDRQMLCDLGYIECDDDEAPEEPSKARAKAKAKAEAP